MSATRTYPVDDRPPGVSHSVARTLRAEATGEYRPPRAGEWYLSGAIPAAYRAAADYAQPYQIARLVSVVRTVTETLEPFEG